MKYKTKKLLSCLLAIIMLLTASPLNGLPSLLSVEADAAGVSGYNAIAAAEWAKAHVGEKTSVLFGTRYWYEGGDCANFVSECMYMGGIDPNPAWNHQGYFAHFSTGSDGSWIRATQLHNYAVSIGGVEIRNPSASQISVGDLIFFKETSNGRFTHSSIVVEAGNGSVSIAAHSTNLTAYITDNWHLNFSGQNTYLVKMNGGTCTNQKVRSFDVYKAGSGAVGYSSPTTNSSRKISFLSGEYAHVYKTQTVNGVTWGYTFRYGTWAWVKLSSLTYKGHYETGPIDHLMGNWYVKVEPTCTEEGIEERKCSRCGYTETRSMGIGGTHKNVVAATCLNPSYCTACGEIISPALGHDWDEWNDETKATCTKDGVEKRECFRCGLKETRPTKALGHDYQAVVALPGCTTTGTTSYKCSRCDDGYIENADWSGYSAIDVNDPKYSEFLNNPELSRSRTEYRYKTKSTTTRTNTTGKAPSLTGYTLSNTTWVWNSYGSWSGWIQGSMSGSDYRQVETKSEHTGYNMVSDVYRKPGNTYRYYTDFYLATAAEREAHGYTAAYTQQEYTRVMTISEVNSATQVAPGKRSPTSPVNFNGYNDISKTGYWLPTYAGDNSSYLVWFIKSNVYTNYYRYRDRTKKYTYTYYKWSDWSDWSTTAQTASDTKQVEKRTTYSFKQSVLGHNWDNGVVIAPTCCDDGYTLYTCKRCGLTMKTDITKALGHDLRDETSEKGWYIISDDGTTKTYRRDCQRNCGYYEIKAESCIYHAVETVAPTCTEDGYTVYQCETHSNETYKSDFVPALGHTPDGNWVVIKAPTCTESGIEQCNCVRHDGGKTCDEVFTREIKPVGHDLVKTEKVEATCEKDGCQEYYTCKNCNAVFSDPEGLTETTTEDLIIPATGHRGTNEAGEEVWVTEQEAGCGVTGRQILYCQNENCDVSKECENCGVIHHKILDEREIEEIQPDYRLVDHKDSTCCTTGYDTYSCVNCIGTDHEHGWTEILGLKEHTWSPWKTGKEPLCIYPGDEERTCTVCGETEFRELPAQYDSHDFETITTDPTCTGSGESYKRCTRCGYEEGKENIDPTGHDMQLDESKSYAPTCTEPGVNHYVCSRGDYEYDEYIEPIGHDYQETEHIPATCTTPGQKVWVCSHDSSHTYTETVAEEPMLGHEFGEWHTIREANYAQTRIDQRDCIRGDLTEYRELPKLDRPVEENEAVNADKTASFNEETGELTINLKTWSEAEELKKQNIYAMPLDIVLVVDQSGSMEEKGKLTALKNAANEFIDTVYEDAKTKSVDHRIAVVGFAMGDYTTDSRSYPKYMNTVLFTGSGKTIQYNRLRAGSGSYEKALVSVNDGGSLNRELAAVSGKFTAKGATAANLGLEMANNIFGANPVNGNDRQRIVVIMTDGEPTRWSGYEKDVADDAIKEANMLKNTYGAAVYSIGFMSDTSVTNQFLNYVSSNYPSATGMQRGGQKASEGYFKKAADISALSEIFKSIATETTEYYTNFKDLTLIDTISEAFTMTTAQETKLREDAMKNLGVRNEDITVTRHENGMTTVEITNITPKQVTENGKVIYRTEFSFTVSANENALKPGTYNTNEDDSGVSLDGESFAAKFSSPEITVDKEHGVAIFNVDGKPFQIVSVTIGGEVEVPEYTIDNNLKWDVPEGYTLSGGTVTFNAESTDSHKHTYEKIVIKPVDCGNDGITEYLCDCGAHYIETAPATGEHHWETTRPTAAEDGFTCKEFRCTQCGEMYNSQLLYKVESVETATGRKAETAVSVTEEIRFGSTDNDSQQPDGEVTITAAVGEYFNTKTLKDIIVYRVEADGGKTKLPSSYSDGIVVFTTDHFCEYIFEAVYVCQETGAHYDDNVDGYCDDCGELVSEWDAFRCKMCPAYEACKDIPIIGVIYTIVHFFVHMAHLIGYKT